MADPYGNPDLTDLMAQFSPEELDQIAQSSVVPERLRQLAQQQQESQHQRLQAQQMPQGRTVRDGIFVASSPLENLAGLLSGAVGGVKGMRERKKAEDLISQMPKGTLSLLQAQARLMGGGPGGPPPSYTPPPPTQNPPPPPNGPAPFNSTPGYGGVMPETSSQFVDQTEGDQRTLIGPDGQVSTSRGAGQEGDVLVNGVPDPAARLRQEAIIKALREKLMKNDQGADDLVWGI
jgi:hypothetical protein